MTYKAIQMFDTKMDEGRKYEKGVNKILSE